MLSTGIVLWLSAMRGWWKGVGEEIVARQQPRRRQRLLICILVKWQYRKQIYVYPHYVPCGTGWHWLCAYLHVSGGHERWRKNSNCMPVRRYEADTVWTLVRWQYDNLSCCDRLNADESNFGPISCLMIGREGIMAEAAEIFMHTSKMTVLCYYAVT